MTEDASKAIDRVRRGYPIECSAEEYRRKIRPAVILFALDCADINDALRMRIALAEVKRLDIEHGFGLSDESTDELT
jgi:hypothetical protein